MAAETLDDALLEGERRVGTPLTSQQLCRRLVQACHTEFERAELLAQINLCGEVLFLDLSANAKRQHPVPCTWVLFEAGVATPSQAKQWHAVR